MRHKPPLTDAPDEADLFTDVKSFITSRRYETTTIHNILQGFSITECDWLAPDRAQPRVTLTDALKRRELLQEFLFWYFDSFLIPLLRVSEGVASEERFRTDPLLIDHFLHHRILSVPTPGPVFQAR